jgi:hypothetical protein
MRELDENDDGGVDGLELQQLGTRDRTPGDIERQVLALSVRSTVDELCAAFDAADWLLSRARGIDRLRREVGIAWIEQNGEFDFGDGHYSVGYPLTVRCRDLRQTGHAVLDAAAGDIDQFLAVLVAQPFKHGSVRGVIGKALHDRLFEARRSGRLIRGVPERTLQRTDRRFLKGRTPAETF